MSLQKCKPFLVLLCKIFLIGLLVQFFLQTFITFQLGWDGSFRSLVRMRKEFILLLLCIASGYALCLQLSKYRHLLTSSSSTGKALRALIKKPALLQFILLFLISAFLFFLIAVVIQKGGLSHFILSFKYDLLPFFIFWLGACLGVLIFTEEDKSLFQLYKKLMVRCLRGGLVRWALVYIMPNALKFVGYDWHAYEGTLGSRPPAAYYTLINQGFVRNQFLFERPISFGFRLIAFFPFFALGFLRKKSIKKQIAYTIGFWLLVLSTWSRAAIAMYGLEVVILALLLHRKLLKNYLWLLTMAVVLGVGGVAYLGQSFFAREHSNTGHLVLIVEGRKLAQHNLVFGRGAGYSGPASHQICYTEEAVNIFATDISHPDPRCEQIRKINAENEISTYGYNPENQYLQIIMEYGIVGTLFRLSLIVRILRYTVKMVRAYRGKEKSHYQTFLRWSLLGFGIGLLGLCGEGMVLHSLGDRMVVYPFFLLYGLTVWGREKVKDIPYIPEVKERKKKKKGKKRK